MHARIKDGLLDPEMSASEMRLQMGEMTGEEVRLVRLALRGSAEAIREGGAFPSGRAALTKRFGPMSADAARLLRAAIGWNMRLHDGA